MLYVKIVQYSGLREALKTP